MTKNQANKIAVYLSQAFGADAYDYLVLPLTLNGMIVNRPNGFYVRMAGERHLIEVTDDMVLTAMNATQPTTIVELSHDVLWRDGEIYFDYEAEGLDVTVIRTIGMYEVQLNAMLARSKRNADDKQ